MASFRSAAGCTEDGRPVTTPPVGALLLVALDRPDHAGIVSPGERDVLRRWVEGGAPSVRGGVHPTRFGDPRAPGSHPDVLRAARWQPMLDKDHPDACGRCHDGTRSRPDGVLYPAPSATACNACHTEPDGIFACTTCHGAPGRSFPPRDGCFFPRDTTGAAHAAHAGTSPSREGGLPCSTCHPAPSSGAPGGTHGDGYVEVWLDTNVAGARATWDPTTKVCANTCHARGAAKPDPSWTARGPTTCNDCHRSPPAAHYEGPCTSCHREADATGTRLAAPKLHVNGKVDLGDGSGGCGACHGRGVDPWPTTGAHQAHASPRDAKPVACETCHVVPAGEKHPTRAGAATVRLIGLATKGGAPARYDAATKTCAATYCHAGPGGNASSPRWDQGTSASACGGCHALPPPAPHPAATTCGGVTCHDNLTTPSNTLTAAGRAVHVDGTIDRRAP